jgi:hypothetical protein
VTAQVVATLTSEAGRKLGLEPDDVAAQLLTTPPNERLDKAVALGVGDSAPQREQLAADLRSVLTSAAQADRDGKEKLHAWSRSSAGEALSRKVTAAFGNARKSAARTGASNDLQRIAAAATSGQTPPGRPRSDVQGAAAAHSQKPSQPTQARGGR